MKRPANITIRRRSRTSPCPRGSSQSKPVGTAHPPPASKAEPARPAAGDGGLGLVLAHRLAHDVGCIAPAPAKVCGLPSPWSDIDLVGQVDVWWHLGGACPGRPGRGFRVVDVDGSAMTS